MASGRSDVSVLPRLKARVCHHPAITATSSATNPLIAPRACGSPLRRIAPGTMNSSTVTTKAIPIRPRVCSFLGLLTTRENSQRASRWRCRIDNAPRSSRGPAFLNGPPILVTLIPASRVAVKKHLEAGLAGCAGVGLLYSSQIRCGCPHAECPAPRKDERTATLVPPEIRAQPGFVAQRSRAGEEFGCATEAKRCCARVTGHCAILASPRSGDRPFVPPWRSS